VVFLCVVGELTPGKDLDDALAVSLEVAVALEVCCVILQISAGVRPTAANKKRLAAVLERVPAEGTVRCWEPAGIWEREEVLALSRSLSVQPVFDVARDQPGPGLITSPRLRALGKTSALGATTLARVAERLRRRREAFVVVEAG